MRNVFLAIILCLIPMEGWAGVQFDGDDNIATAQHNFAASADFSIMAWFKTTATGGWICGAFVTEEYHEVRVEATIKDLRAYIDSTVGGSVNVTATGTFDDGAWHMVVYGRTGGAIFISADGAAKTTGSSQNNEISPAIPFTIGHRLGTGGSFVGTIGEVAIWDVALSDAEIALLYNSRIKRIALQIQPSSLWGYWPLDDEEDGTDGHNDIFVNQADPGVANGTGTQGTGAGLTAKAEEVLSYPWAAIYVHAEAAAGGAGTILNGVECRSVIIY